MTIHQEVERRVLVVDAHGNDDGGRAFGLRLQDFEFSNLAVITLLAPVVQKFVETVRRAGLPEPVSLSVIALMESGQEMLDRAFLRIVPQPVAQKTACQKNHDDQEGKQLLDFAAL